MPTHGTGIAVSLSKLQQMEMAERLRGEKAKAWRDMKKRMDHEHALFCIGIDPAVAEQNKPHAIIFESISRGRDRWFEMRSAVQKSEGEQMGLAMIVPPTPCEIADAAFGKPEAEQPTPAVEDKEQDRAWDLLVLAARASRYGE